MTLSDVVRAIDEALSESQLHVIVMANEGLMVETPDGETFIVDVRKSL